MEQINYTALAEALKRIIEMPDLVYSVKEAASILKTSKIFIHNEVKAGRIKAIQISGLTKIRHTEILRYLDMLEVESEKTESA